MFKGIYKRQRKESQIANIHWIIEKQECSRKKIYFYFIDYAKAFDYVYHNKLWKILQEMGMPDYMTCILRNLCAGQEATVITGRGTMDWFQIEKGVHQGTCHFAHPTYIQNASYEMTGWLKHKLESRLLREISITSDIQMTTTSWWKAKKN